MTLKTYIFGASLVLLSGCADTPENHQFWNSLGQALQGGAQGLNQEANRMKQPLPQQQNIQTNCYTTYDRYGAYTTCTSQ